MTKWMNGGMAAVLALGLIGCGGGGGTTTDAKKSTGKKKSGKKKGTAKKAKPAPKPAPKVVDGADSPEDLYNRMAAAAKDKSFIKVAHLIAPDDRATVCGVMTMGAGMIAAFSTMGIKDKAEQEKTKKALEGELEALLKKHGIDKSKMEMDPNDPSKMGTPFKGKDTIKFLEDVMAWMEKHGGEKKSMANDFPVEGKLEDLKVEGDTATAKIAGKTRAMKKVGGRWYMDMLKH